MCEKKKERKGGKKKKSKKENRLSVRWVVLDFFSFCLLGLQI